jgi:hypothetical protein
MAHNLSSNNMTDMHLQLKTDVMGRWIAKEWNAKRPEHDWITVIISRSCVNDLALSKFGKEKEFQQRQTTIRRIRI